jgi:aminoglycoside 6'-N-acetyltransferase
MTLLYGSCVVLRPVTDGDVDRLAAILAEPDVALWWPGYDAARVRREFIETPSIVAFSIDTGDELIGCAQYHEEPAGDYRYATMDVFLASACHGKGLGTDAIRTLTRHLIHDRGHHRLQIDPPADNEKAIRAYQRVGFKPVGIMRQYARDGEGELRDGLLMDLLKRDLQ